MRVRIKKMKIKSIGTQVNLEIDTEAPHLPGFIAIEDSEKIKHKSGNVEYAAATSYISLDDITHIKILGDDRKDWAEWIEANFGKNTQTQENKK